MRTVILIIALITLTLLILALLLQSKVLLGIGFVIAIVGSFILLLRTFVKILIEHLNE